MHEELFSRLVGDIYESPYDEDLWRSVLDRIVVETGSRFVLVSAVDLRDKKYLRQHWHGPQESRFADGIAEYEAMMMGSDPLLTWAAQNPQARFAESRAALIATGRDPDSDAYVRWTAAQLGSGHNAVCYSAPVDELTLGISLNLPVARPAYTPTQIARFRMLFDHMERAMRLVARPPDLNATGDAVLLVDAQCRIRSASPAAEALLRLADGLGIAQGRLFAGNLDTEQSLLRLVARTAGMRAAGLPGGAITVARPSGAADWLITADPLALGHTTFAPFQPQVLLRIVERRGRKRFTPLLAELFSLTPTETRLLLAMLTEDMALPEAAAQLRLSLATARVHMRHILAKVGVRSQSELLRLIERIER